jgi:hypothetical protein
MTNKTQSDNWLAELDRISSAEQNKLNGNSKRRVMGLLTKRDTKHWLTKEGTTEQNKSYNSSIDERQTSYLDSIGPVAVPYLPSVINHFEGKGLFCHNPNLTYSFEVLQQIAKEREQVLGFITVQLSEKITAQLYAEKSPITRIRKLITYRAGKLLKDPLRGLIVLERSHCVCHGEVAQGGSEDQESDFKSGLHIHMLLVGERKEIDLLKDVNIKYSLRSLSSPAANSVVIQYDYLIKRLGESEGGLRSDCIVKSRLPIDGSLPDYLSKELHKPISSFDKQNFGLIGIRSEVKSLWKLNYRKQILLLEEVAGIRRLINFGCDPGDMQARISKVLSWVKTLRQLPALKKSS